MSTRPTRSSLRLARTQPSRWCVARIPKHDRPSLRERATVQSRLGVAHARSSWLPWTRAARTTGCAPLSASPPARKADVDRSANEDCAPCGARPHGGRCGAVRGYSTRLRSCRGVGSAGGRVGSGSAEVSAMIVGVVDPDVVSVPSPSRTGGGVGERDCYGRRIEDRAALDRWIARATTPRGAAIVIASVMTSTTVVAGLVMTVLDHGAFRRSDPGCGGLSRR